MSNEVAKQKSDSPYNIESFGRKSKTVSVLNLWALATDKQMRALLKGALVFMDA